MAVDDVVLVTGGTGFIGFRTLRYALEEGYTVRAAVRSEAKAETIRRNSTLSSIKDLSSKLSFTIVPDFLADGAFDEAVKGVKYVLHVASPLTTGFTVTDDLEAGIIKPAVQGTLGLFESAKKESSVKRIVVTSSMVAIPPIAVLIGQQASEHVFSPKDRAHDVPGPYPAVIVAYVQSKIAALKEGEAWVEKHKPQFDVIHIHPSYVGGRNDLAQTVEELCTGTNPIFLESVLGKDSDEYPGPRVANYIDVDDVAKAHVLSLSEKVAGGQSFLLTNEGGDMKWNDAQAIAKKHFPDAVKSGLLPNDFAEQQFMVLHCDISKTEETFGKIKSYEETIKALVGQYLELKEKAM
ncbi:hypothetical protein LTR02_017719 [Friedmanniomyces endolithicus]|nr:hypothetical protein LTS09_009111 [Friedmanniomyces endolithicus]KAK0361318.1 hypothetical protein LTR94_023806 [Friedmanniomyces endolithicus]KAK0779317.1 hypothetical protein LTR59_013224 [Friedmanniomyces endolithicus]KAK0860313.1 hypothetical protein LTS02_008537 [Friedmanniomyces endolithicus]KAK0876272.1 hypothetical protein LTR87_009936 [Friedmanniomyces endolithicus]